MRTQTKHAGWKLVAVPSDGISGLAADWDDLARASAFPTVFSLHGFASAWWGAFGAQRHSHVLRVEDADGKTRLIAPFNARNGQPDDWSLIGHGQADYEAVLVARGDKDAVEFFKDRLRANQPWRHLQLDHVEMSAHTDWLPTIERDGNRWRNARRLFTSSYPLGFQIKEKQHPYFSAPDFPALADKTQGRDFRKHENWFSKRGVLRYECVRETLHIERLLDVVCDLHVKKWNTKDAASGLSDPHHRAFLRALPSALAAHGATRLDLLWWNDAPVAAHFGFQWEGRLYWYITTYDPQVGAHSPGKLLLANVIRNAASDGLREVDLLRGQEAYKYHYASQVRSTVRLTLYRSRRALFSNWIARRWPALTLSQETSI